MKSNYTAPEMEVITVNSYDVITASGLPNDNHPGDNKVDLGM